MPLLVVRVRELQRVAWREGRPAARKIERRCWRNFVAGAGKVLRAGDVLGHAPDSEDFLAALLSGARSAGARASSVDCRAALRRLEGGLARDCGPGVESGWTMLEAGARDQDLHGAIERALANGARERERYAFFSTVGHELRTPLSAVRGYIETLLDERLDPATARQYLETARAETLRMNRLVERMLDISLLDLRDAVTAGRAFLGPSVEAAAAAVAPLALARGSKLEFAPCADIEIGLSGDSLVQVLVNLLENAVKHGRAGGRVEFAATMRASHVEVCVDDDGPGIPAAEREAVFGLGRRGQSARAPGSGLGLAFVRLMLERTGGAVEACDSPLGGARFRLCLPLPPG